jgi:hypothetical protein
MSCRKLNNEKVCNLCDWKGLHDEELHNLYASPNIVIVIKWGGG